MRSGLGTAARLVRGSVLGVTWAFALLGVASAHDGASWPTVARVLVVATAFHVAVYVWNDLLDLPLDRTEPRRATSPLVLGTVSPRAALAVSSGAAVVALVLLTSLEAVLAMAAGLALLAAYDVWGKRCAFPPLTDAVQGLGWAALVWAGAASAGGATVLTAWLGAAVVAQILLVNGVVGAGRDVPNDQRHGARTTALLLGARAEEDGVRLTTALRVYGVALHVLTVALVLGALAAGGGASPGRVALVLGGGALAGVALVGALTAAGRARAWTAGL
ncbi:UbiA family prenyltransferase, partial [Actinotalea ferrariae]|uniref:UbiA family prenyltransferase n=1 Tax=Actinotalea ferrariae TaxID=1386098 RepID=UPI001C8CC4F5